MNTFNNSITLTSRPDLLGIYAGIIARIATASNIVALEENLSCLEIAQQPNIYETAYLKDGMEGIIEVVCHELMQMGFLEIHNAEIRVATYFKKTSHLEPLEQAIFDYLHVPKTAIALKESKELHKEIAPYGQQYRTALISKGYLQPDNTKYLTLGFGGLVILALAILKPMSGLLASYRHLMLLAMVAMPKASLAIAATTWLTTRSKSNKLTAKGKAYLKNYQ